MRRYVHAGLVFGIVLASGTAHAAVQINESEPNNPIRFAQRVDGNVAISAVLGNIDGQAVNDTDYYTFYGLEGDVLTFDIDGGDGGARNVDTIIAVFGAGPGYRILRLNDDAAQNDDADSVDEGSTSLLDSRLENVRLPASGYYVVGVSDYLRPFEDGGGVVQENYFENGDYKLIVTGATPQVKQINIEIKPGSDELAPINPRAHGKIPVALLSSSGFTAMNVDSKSLTFGATGDEKSLSHCGRNGEDVNGDGRPDLVCHFENQKAGFAKGDLEGIVRGTIYGERFEGRGILKVVPEKRGS